MEHPYLALLLLLSTIAIFGWIFWIKEKTLKFFYLIFILFLYIYCGIGICYEVHPNSNYITTYLIYAITLSISFHFFRRIKIKVPSNSNINAFSESMALPIVALYLSLCLIPLTQSGNLGNLVHPPMPDLSAITSERDYTVNALSNIADSFKNFIYVFYFLALFRYVKKPLILSLLLILPMYITYCDSGYAARSGTATQLSLVLFVIFYFYPKYRKFILTATIIAVPGLVIFLVAYTNIRMGGIVESIGVWDSFQILLESESYYPLWYDSIKDDSVYVGNYLYWLITSPLPGFLKPFDINVNFNALFTADVLGIPLNSVQSISLPGLVNEGVFIFGKHFFFIHAIIFAFIFNLTYNTLKVNVRNCVALFAMMTQFSMLSCRGGTAVYSIAIKVLLILFLFYVFVPRKKDRNVVPV